MIDQVKISALAAVFLFIGGASTHAAGSAHGPAVLAQDFDPAQRFEEFMEWKRELESRGSAAELRPNTQPSCPGGMGERWIPIPACGTYGDSPTYVPGLHHCGYRYDASQGRCVERCWWQGTCSADPH